MKYTLFLLILLCAFSNKISACTCGPYGPVFCVNISADEFMVLAVVTDPLDYYDMEILVLDDLSGAEVDTIRILGQDGLNCGESLTGFELGDTLVLGLQNMKISDALNDEEYDWFLDGCGKHFLHVRNNMISGYIFNAQDSISIDYSEFKSSIERCVLVASVETNQDPMEEAFDIFPNPAADFLYVNVAFQQNEEYSYDILSATGQVVTPNLKLVPGKNVVNISNLPSRNIYFIRQRSIKGHGSIQKFVKLL